MNGPCILISYIYKEGNYCADKLTSVYFSLDDILSGSLLQL